MIRMPLLPYIHVFSIIGGMIGLWIFLLILQRCFGNIAVIF